MKAFTKENMLAYMATLSEVEDEHYDSPQNLATTFVENFEAWLEIADLPKIKLPVTVRGFKVVAADGNLIATCGSSAMAKSMALQLNAKHVPNDEQRTDKEAERLAGNISASGKRVRREVRVKSSDDESWDKVGLVKQKSKQATKVKKVKK